MSNEVKPSLRDINKKTAADLLQFYSIMAEPNFDLFIEIIRDHNPDFPYDIAETVWFIISTLKGDANA